MGKVRVSAFAFLFSGIFLAICCFLPLKTLTVTGIIEETSVLRLMPSMSGFLVIILAGACILFPILGYKSYAALAGTGAALVGGGLLWYYTAQAEASTAQISNFENVLGGMLSTSSSASEAASVTVTTNFGFSLTIIALVLVLVTGFIYTFINEN